MQHFNVSICTIKMKFIFLLVNCVLFVAISAAKIKPKSEIVLVDDIEEYRRDHPGVELYEMEKPVQQPGVGIRYTLGTRQPGDEVVAEESDHLMYETHRDVELVTNYPSSAGETGAIVTYIQIDVNQDTKKGRGFVAAGGIGQRRIQVIIEALHTKYFEHHTLIYGMH